MCPHRGQNRPNALINLARRRPDSGRLPLSGRIRPKSARNPPKLARGRAALAWNRTILASRPRSAKGDLRSIYGLRDASRMRQNDYAHIRMLESHEFVRGDGEASDFPFGQVWRGSSIGRRRRPCSADECGRSQVRRERASGALAVQEDGSVGSDFRRSNGVIRYVERARTWRSRQTIDLSSSRLSTEAREEHCLHLGGEKTLPIRRSTSWC